ncbi:Arabinanase/levansucrase/invertase [Microthyrium microscopicum]|uniref:Arabinanase/levansucrase/invertase n=1 Tax=Microthyrium microscopicum TaxID=703497 RepID=A0A6A6TUP8_9PEZI|nr:Arabinanase/levansucrase/invertase [Microthyrium microscopicum]
MSYNNTVLTITDVSTPDPFVVQAHGRYYLTFTAGDHVEVWCSDNLLTLGSNCEKTTVWRPPPNTHYSGGVWAPELHDIGGRWYIYVACENPPEGNKSHRMYVLGGPPSTQTPCVPDWEFLGPIQGLPPQQWAIDGTVASIGGYLYFIYSGWPFDNHQLSDKVQELFIIRLTSATTAAGPAVCICQPREHWERSDASAINEGPQWLSSPDGGWQGIVYSCAGSWTRDYKMNTIRYLGGDPVDPRSWSKSRRPLLTARGPNGGGPYGPGHGSFVQTMGETWAVFHGTDRETDGWENRKARVQRVVWTAEGPYMSGTVGRLVGNEAAFLAVSTGGGFPGSQGGGQQNVFSRSKRLSGFMDKMKKKINEF